jgi:hypothetical protein
LKVIILLYYPNIYLKGQRLYIVCTNKEIAYLGQGADNMFDITKEEFWEVKDEEVPKVKEQKRSIKEYILSHKLLSIGLLVFGICAFANIVLIYSFFKMIQNI